MSALLLAVLAGSYAQEAPAGEVTRAPTLVRFVGAAFPESETGKTGSVVLLVTVAEDGTVTDAVVQESAGPAFDAAAADAVRRFVFTPGEIDGAPATTRILYRYDFVEQTVPPTTAVFSGIVRDQELLEPLSGVKVTLGDDRSVVTDEQGRFQFDDVAPGAAYVTLEDDRFAVLSIEESFVAGEKLEAAYDLALTSGDDDYMEIVVSASAVTRQAVSTTVGAEEARKVPGTQGDVLRVVENLPGVARASVGTGALVVWGAAPEDTGVYVDGVRVPRLYHDGGLRSVVGSDFVDSVELVPGGYGAEYGRGLGGLVAVRTKAFDDETHIGASADLFDAAGSVRTPVSERLNVGVAGRYGYVGPLLSTTTPWPRASSPGDDWDIEDYFPVPHYYDIQGRIGYDLGVGESVDVTALASSDRTERTAPSADPAREASEEKRLRFNRVYARYQRDLGDGTRISAMAFAGEDVSSQVLRYGPVETAIETRAVTSGLRTSYRERLTPFLSAEGGVDAEVVRTQVSRKGAVAMPPREGDVRVFGQPPPDQISSDEYEVATVNVAPYARADLSLLHERLDVSAGLRFDPYARSVSQAAPKVGISPTNGLYLQDFRFEPRLSARWSIDGQWSVMAATGRYGQSPQAADLSSSFGNPELPAAEGTHYVVGAGYAPLETLHADATAFLTTASGVAMRNQASQPARAEALAASGSARTYGAQLMIRLDPTFGFYGWVSYTLARAERRDAPELDWRPSDYDQRHVLTALGGHELPFGIDVGVRARLSTGYPRTEVVGAYLDNRRDLWQPVFGEHNAARLPTFFQADLRAAKVWTLGDGELEASFELQNLTNRQNVEEWIYAADYSERGAIRGLPILPVVGLRWSS